MAKAELMEEAGTAGSTGPVDVLIGVAGSADLVDLQAAGDHTAAVFGATMPNTRVALAYADVGEAAAAPEGEIGRHTQLLSYKTGNATPGGPPWLPSSATYSGLFALAASTGAQATVVISSDLAALQSDAAVRLAAPILAGQCELAMPIYSRSRFAGLLNASILAPFTRALYGKRILYPLAQDFAFAPALVPIFEHPAKRAQQGSENLFWPATQAATQERKLCQVYVDTQHETLAEGVDLTTVLTQIVGPLFADMETKAPIWQRVRGSHAVPASGVPFPAAAETGKIDTRPMVESFTLATRNLQDVWSLILPPVTQLELKRLGRVTSDQFRVPDALWVRILYDFALAHRLRTLSRSHLMGALTPLYLAWVASYVGEVDTLSEQAVDARLEQLALAFETGKPYLLSRWRWPDRFNP